MVRLFRLYDERREALLWFLHELEARTYEEYKAMYLGVSKERAHFTSVCGFFELAGVLVKDRAIDQSLFFDMFNPSPYWKRARPVVEGMRKDRPYIYENFEQLADARELWASKRRRR